jgi:hypothetical protein
LDLERAIAEGVQAKVQVLRLLFRGEWVVLTSSFPSENVVFPSRNVDFSSEKEGFFKKMRGSCIFFWTNGEKCLH